MAQVYPDIDARLGLTTLSRLRHRQWTGEAVFVQLNEDVGMFLGEARFGVLATVNASGCPQQTVMRYDLRGNTVVLDTNLGCKKDRVDRVDVDRFDGEV